MSDTLWQERASQNVYQRGAIQDTGKGSEDTYICAIHRADDCKTCFDWERIVQEEIIAERADAKWLKRRKELIERVDWASA